MEPGVQFDEALGLAAVHGVVAFLENLLDFQDQCGVAALRGELGVETFERGAHLDHLAGDIGRQARHRRPAPGLDLDQSFCRQRAQRLAHRNAGHAQLLRQRVLHQPLAGVVLAAEDALPQRIGHKREKRGMLGAQAGSRGVRIRAEGTGGGVVHGRDRPWKSWIAQET
ncbi:hypothetical protein D3C86_1496460 [compost metagenome]